MNKLVRAFTRTSDTRNTRINGCDAMAEQPTVSQATDADKFASARAPSPAPAPTISPAHEGNVSNTTVCVEGGHARGATLEGEVTDYALLQDEHFCLDLHADTRALVEVRGWDRRVSAATGLPRVQAS